MHANKVAVPIFGAAIMAEKTINAPQNPPVQSHQGAEVILMAEGQGMLEDKPKTARAKVPTIKEIIAANIGLPEIWARLALTVA